MKKKLIIGGLIVVLIFGIVGWKLHMSKPAVPVQVPVVPTVKVEKGEIEKTVFAKGSIYDASQKEINSEVKGIVERVPVSKGSAVKKGDLLFSINKTDVLLEMESAQLNCETKRRAFEKAKESASSNIVKAEISGRITKLSFKEGDKVEKDTVVAEMTDVDYLEVTTPFGPVNSNKIQLHKKARVFLTSYLNDVEGEIIKIDRHGKGSDDGGISYDVTVRFKNPGVVKSGDTASVRVVFDDGMSIDSLDNSKLKEPEAVKIRSKSGGCISTLNVAEGDFLNEGTVLMQMDVSDSQDSLKDMELELRRAELELDLKKKDLQKYDVCADQDGVVSEVNAVVGQEPPTDKIAVIISGLKKLQMRAKVEEADIPLIKVGQQAKVFANAFEDRPYLASVIDISAQGKAEGNTNVYEIKLEIEDPSGLMVGMSGDADISVLKKEDILRLPATAVNINGKMGTVMLKGQGTLIPKEIKIGIEADEFVEIVEGLNEGDEVLISSPEQVQHPVG